MLRLLFDENFNHDMVRGVRLRLPEADVLTVQEALLRGIDDPALLAWAVEEGRILVTHDFRTMIGFAYDRIAIGEPMAGVFAIADDAPVGEVIEHLVLLIACSEPEEWANLVTFVPLA
jgi:predicted nuclease of predicted toxin-antitoxin system